LAEAAKDALAIALNQRRRGGEQNLAKATTWEQAARDMISGKEAWVRLRDEVQAAARYEAFIKRDANTVSDQELAEAAKDAFAVAQNQRRRGGEQNLANAATWEQAGRNLRAGKEAWIKLRRLEQAREAANAAVGRYNAFLKKDASTVSEQELFRTAADCDFVAQEVRWEGGEQNLANAAAWDQAARNLRAGKDAYVRQRAGQATNGPMTAEQFQFLSNALARRTATALNMIGISSGYHYEVRSR
jgi:hypothetical protein